MLQRILLFAVVLVFVGCQPSEQKAEAESSVPDSIFGFKKGMTARTVKHLIDGYNSNPPLIFQSSDNIQFTFSYAPEKYHNLDFFETYLLEVSKEVGLYSVKGTSEISELDLSYNRIPKDRLKPLGLDRYRKLRELLKRDYGEYTEHDYLKSDSIFDGASFKDWAEGLDQGDRVLLSYWENDRLYRAGIKLILLEVSASSGPIPEVSVDVTIEFTNMPESKYSRGYFLEKIEAYRAKNK